LEKVGSCGFRRVAACFYSRYLRSAEQGRHPGRTQPKRRAGFEPKSDEPAKHAFGPDAQPIAFPPQHRAERSPDALGAENERSAQQRVASQLGILSAQSAIR
jgi:hypothetical protein